jgi:hypothetical protein
VKFAAVIRNTVQASADAGIPVFLADEADAFSGHNVCDKTPWVHTPNLLQSLDIHQEQQFFHPLTAGYNAEGTILYNDLASLGLN